MSVARLRPTGQRIGPAAKPDDEEEGLLDIERGLPIPGRNGRPPMLEVQKLIRTVERMNVGESCVTPVAYTTFWTHFKRRKDLKITCRTLKNGDVRVWRIK